LASKKFSCNLCNVSFGANNQLENHKLTQKHINNASGIIKAVKNPTVRNACPVILLHANTTAALAIMLPRLRKSSIIISRRQSTSRRWLWPSQALSSTYLQGLRTILDFLGLFSSSL